jgi:hypothetical protein
MQIAKPNLHDVLRRQASSAILCGMENPTSKLIAAAQHKHTAELGIIHTLYLSSMTGRIMKCAKLGLECTLSAGEVAALAYQIAESTEKVRAEVTP